MVEESAMHGGALERDGRVSEMRTLRVLLLGIVTWICRLLVRVMTVVCFTLVSRGF